MPPTSTTARGSRSDAVGHPLDRSRCRSIRGRCAIPRYARQGVGHAFVDAVEQTLSRITAHPYANPQIPGQPQSTRKAVLADYGYWIIYEVHAEAIVVLTVWHAIRKPESWRTD